MTHRERATLTLAYLLAIAAAMIGGVLIPACAAAWPCRCGCARQRGNSMTHTIRNAAIIILALLLAALLGLAVALILA